MTTAGDGDDLAAMRAGLGGDAERVTGSGTLRGASWWKRGIEGRFRRDPGPTEELKMSELDIEVLIGGVDRGVVSKTTVLPLEESIWIGSGRERCEAVELGLVSRGIGGDGCPLWTHELFEGE